MIQKDIPGLVAYEHGFQLDTGELVVVSLISPQSQEAGVIAITIKARAVDAQGKTLIVNGRKVEMPGHTATLLHEHLGDSTVDALPHIAMIMEQEAQKVRGFKSALETLSALTIGKKA